MQHDFSLKVQLQQQIFVQKLDFVKGTKDLITPVGMEKWVVNAKLMSDFPAIPTWQSQEGVPENERQQSVRARFWAHLIIVLPSKLHKDLPDGDVRGVYEHLVTIDKHRVRNCL